MGSFIYSTKVNHTEKYIEDKIFPEYLYVNPNPYGRNPKFIICSDHYWRKCKEWGKVFYFSFPWMPNWVEDIVNEFNNLFKNIHISMFRNKETELRSDTYRFFPYKKYNTNTQTFFNGKIPTFITEYLNDYPEVFKLYSNFLIHHYFRSFNIFEEFHTNYDNIKMLLDEKFLGESPLKFIIDDNNYNIANGHSTYRALSSYYISPEDFLLLDDIELIKMMSKLLNLNIRRTAYKQTLLFQMLKGYNKFRDIKVGDKVVTNDYYYRVYGGNIRGEYVGDSKSSYLIQTAVIKRDQRFIKTNPFDYTDNSNIIKICHYFLERA